jgi:hypothetical protein
METQRATRLNNTRRIYWTSDSDVDDVADDYDNDVDEDVNEDDNTDASVLMLCTKIWCGQ